MNDKVFLDTNILLYSYSHSEVDKQTIARNLVTDYNTVISTQVLQEFTNIITKKFKVDYGFAKNAITEHLHNHNLHINTESTIITACDIASRYKYSFYDSLIVAAAIESNCTILYSEDLQTGQIINGQLEISNPFK